MGASLVSITAVQADMKTLATGEAHFCAPAFSYVLRTKTGTFFVTLFSPISIALRPSRPASRPASKLAPKCFVLIPWSRDAGARDLH